MKRKRVRKTDLPSKACVACGRPFAWRRKWRNAWDEVKYCSDACRRRRQAAKLAGGHGGATDD